MTLEELKENILIDVKDLFLILPKVSIKDQKTLTEIKEETVEYILRYFKEYEDILGEKQ